MSSSDFGYGRDQFRGYLKSLLPTCYCTVSLVTPGLHLRAVDVVRKADGPHQSSPRVTAFAITFVFVFTDQFTYQLCYFYLCRVNPYAHVMLYIKATARLFSSFIFYTFYTCLHEIQVQLLDLRCVFLGPTQRFRVDFWGSSRYADLGSLGCLIHLGEVFSVFTYLLTYFYLSLLFLSLSSTLLSHITVYWRSFVGDFCE